MVATGALFSMRYDDLRSNPSSLLNWALVDASMNTFIPASSGYTLAKRGFVTLSDGRIIFVKIGTDDTTKKWINKEIDAYLFLQSNGYRHIPRLLSKRDDNTGFALEYLNGSDGWKWDSGWTELRLNKTLEAMDSLANVETPELPDSFNKIRMIKDIKNPWQIFIDDPDARIKLVAKLNISNRKDISHKIFADDFLAQSFDFKLPQNKLTHYDIRSDNCAWNANTQKVMLIDWNWIQLGNRDIDINSLLVSIVKSGFTIPYDVAHRLNKGALIWLAGSWFGASIGSIEGSTSEDERLREYQLQSAIVAYELSLGV